MAEQRSPQPLRLFLLLAAVLLAACGKQADPAAGAPPGGGMPPPEVGVVTVSVGDVGLVTELPGRLEASRVAQVRARAAGIVQERLFREGSDVKAGQPLFRIDPAQLQAASASAQATLARAQANLGQATALAERYKPLVEANAISKQEYANAVAAQKAAEAEVAAGRASVQTAQINLNYSLVTSPISGRIGRALVTEGALVGQGEATPLALVQQINPLYVNITQSSTEVLNLRRALEQGRLKRSGEGTQVRVLLEDGSEYPQAGRLLFSDLQVDPASGQVQLRAEVPNGTGLLLPGMYVRVRLEQARATNVIQVPQQAVTRSGQGDSVMVVGADGQVSPRPVKVGTAQNGRWIILEGLKAGEQVVVDGFQKIRPGAPVKPVPWTAAGTAPAAAAGASAPASAPGAGASAPRAASSAQRS
ncbi:MAG TPA: efflux RND transporter periplasmic adaptor subunit [Ramlibacter sp.]|jgi:membrane fusion protein (multidrug efflux system)|uniref:efflux RND transporter periplasmic adaptor subunit n=1 Tax=Ramlibacter sp. TaxID=1917967 RepID=UPI002D6C07E6|nr:efflux RND transporter periplasmic adaptor subunit [Ramlibacter sp.]HZY20276.1 efflux RND transporter periplasmic adaptor subunit [Ramlibacter sp.]